LLICRVLSRMPRPKSSTPALFEATVEVLHAGVADRGDQVLGDAAEPEAAGGDGHAVEQQAVERLGCGGIDLLHSGPPFPARRLMRWILADANAPPQSETGGGKSRGEGRER
jgi:hypothetical protein